MPGFVEITNGNYTISYTLRPDGSIPEIAIRRVKSLIDRLHSRFPPVAKKILVSITRDRIESVKVADGEVAGSTRLSLPGEEANAITLSEQSVNSDRPVGAVNRSGLYQASDLSVSFAEWVIAHEWGHTTDRDLIDPEPPELFEFWSSKPLGYGLGRYARTSRAEAYADCFADWITSEGKTTNPATLAYAKFYDWEIP